jgi:glucose-1-phosphate cytidylyltransferase
VKVVLFCGGLGTRLRDYSDEIPKPMVPVGYRPVLWHVMKYYASFGHTDFILALGYKADVIKRFFLDYDEAVSNDFVMSDGGRSIDMLATDIQDWRITFVDTGVMASVRERLVAVRRLVEGESMFLCNYSDGLTDLPLDEYVKNFENSDAVAQILTVPPPLTYHRVDTVGTTSPVVDIRPIRGSGLWINGGYFVFRPEIFDYMVDGDELVMGTFRRLMDDGKLTAHQYEGFWAPMDTFKEKQQLDDLWATGDAPWQVWKRTDG